jgi:hypothetical protein
VIFASVALAVLGFFNMLDGIAAISQSRWSPGGPGTVDAAAAGMSPAR